MRRIALVTLVAALPLSLFASRARAQAGGDTLRRWNDSVDMLLRRVSPSVVQIMVTGYRTVSEGDRGWSDPSPESVAQDDSELIEGFSLRKAR
jgi:hypothetical protein